MENLSKELYMLKSLRILYIAYLAFFFYLCGVAPAYADGELDDIKALLQKSLSIYEIDQEISRLTVKEGQIAAQITQTGKEITVQEEKVEQTRNRVGKVLRAYYMGERESVWMLVFSANSFSDALYIYEYLTMIFQNDQMILKTYKQSYEELKHVNQQLERTQAELRDVKSRFIAQRERVLQLQREVDVQINKHPETKAVLLTKIEAITNSWKEQGIPLFKKYFGAISKAMQNLPELLGGDNKGKYLNGLTFQISDTDLNAFFRSKNPIFNNMSFRFTDGQFTAEGKENGVAVSIIGRYTVEESPNRLQFHVDRLIFNDFVLPDTTNKDFEKQFDLGFQPQSYVAFLQAKDVSTVDGKLTINLQVVLK
jgi:hypothetical protein